MTFRSLTLACGVVTIAALALSPAVAAPKSHDHGNGGGNAHANNSGNGGGNGKSADHGNSGTPHSAVRQYVLANGLKQGDIASTLKSWNSLNANPHAFLNNLDNPNSLLGKVAKYICDSAASQTALTGFTDLGGTVGSPPAQQAATDAQAFLDANTQAFADAVTALDGADPADVTANPGDYTSAQVDAADLLNQKAAAETTIAQYNAWTTYQGASQQASDSFAAASVSYHKATDLSEVRAKVDGVIAQKGFDTSALCQTSVASSD